MLTKEFQTPGQVQIYQKPRVFHSIMNTNEMDFDQFADNGPLVIQFQPGKLKEDLAAVSFAAALLHYKLTYLRQYGGEKFNLKALDLAGFTNNVPNEIQIIINPLVKNMEKTWTEWCRHHVENVFKPSPFPDYMIDWFDRIVWLPKGAINYEQTAKNLVNSEKITNEQKYQVACAYCLIDDVERLKRAVMQDSSEEVDGFWNYWSYRLSNRQPKNALELLNDAINVFWRYNKESDVLKPYDEWAVIEYCFDQLDDEHRVNKAGSLILHTTPRVTLNLLQKLTGPELDTVFERRGSFFLRSLVKKFDYFEYTILIWKRMVHVISDLVLVDVIIFLNDLDYDGNYVNPLLLEIWRSTSERQKNYIISQEYLDFMGRNNFSPNFSVILDILSRCNPERKYQYWLDNWPSLVIGPLDSVNRSTVDHIMKLCMVDDQKIENFKKTNMLYYNRSQYSCNYLICVGRIKEIQSYLEFCTSDLEVIRDVKKTIISGMPKNLILQSYLQWSNEEITRDFHQYLDDIFTENESKKFLNEIITYPDSLKIMREKLKTPTRLGDVMKIVEKFASSEEYLIKVKRDLFKLCRVDASIQESVIYDLMGWCMNADQSVVEKFKNVSFDEDIAEEEEYLEDNVYDMFIEYYECE